MLTNRDLPAVVQVNQLQLGDRVSFSFKEGYDTGTIYRIDPNGNAHVWRPYVSTSDFACGGPSVIPYIGIEDFVLIGNSSIKLLYRDPPTK